LVEVEAKKETKTEAPFFRKIDSIFHDQNIAKNVLFNQSFDIPILGRKLEVPYAYQNGCLNLVKPTSFSTRESLALSQAEKLAVQGKLIQEHSTRDEEKALIIIPDIAQAKTEEKILQLFQSFDIRCVHPTTLQDFEDEIRQTIKALPNPT
ncbi:MAG TPA: hypothetical protein DCE42_17780, partial [Myxococcales bacterium]|nr:hypothetical protein [Myxococcales bacterium]